MQAQAPICPYCNNDHSSLTQCDPKELKKIILKYELDDLLDLLQFNNGFNLKENTEIKQFKRMIDWL